MKEIASAVTALLAFLVPLGIYCMLLAFINRRTKPLMVRGTWDAIGLVGAMSGFLLWTVPTLIDEICRRMFDALEAPYLYSTLWIVYYFFLVFFCTAMLYFRSTKTMLYNIDTKLLPTLLEQTFAKLGLTAHDQRGRLTLTSTKLDVGRQTSFASKPTTLLPVSDDKRHAELMIENFAPMCHATLHWQHCEPYLRQQIEEELERGFDLAAPEENAAAGWFYSISGLIFGALFMVAAMILFLILFPK